MTFVISSIGGRLLNWVSDIIAGWDESHIITGISLRKKLSNAIAGALCHHHALVAFTEGISAEDATLTDKWEKLVEAWENDRSKPCPYDLPSEDCKFLSSMVLS